VPKRSKLGPIEKRKLNKIAHALPDGDPGMDEATTAEYLQVAERCGTRVLFRIAESFVPSDWSTTTGSERWSRGRRLDELSVIGLSSLLPSDGVDSLLAKLVGMDEGISVRVLSNIGGDRIKEEMVKYLGANDSDLNWIAATVLARIGDHSVCRHIAELAKKPSTRYVGQINARNAAIRALGELKCADQLDVIALGLDVQQNHIATIATAIKALKEFGNRALLPLLSSASKYPVQFETSMNEGGTQHAAKWSPIWGGMESVLKALANFDDPRVQDLFNAMGQIPVKPQGMKLAQFTAAKKIKDIAADCTGNEEYRLKYPA
jgi:HEAT repeat protein